ncbi:unnamed protein product [Chondrus crispus]|uniref:D-lactate dehydrogenase n=1 Tax=Chondrus crispus TaxID=2769 RepID=R7QAC6_CHOCR|nr:unnamed protein product [Chondrus crispus]CDF35467.1 unnamed protein product [Chondrus crispus]|eukprot:XP_005715286.1 unnamed protein product [Chondrus crispus]
MKVTVFSSKRYERDFLRQHPTLTRVTPHIDFEFLAMPLSEGTAPLAAGSDAVCAFVNDALDAPVIARLAEGAVRCILLRCAGFNHVDLAAASKHRIKVLRVPAYSPFAVAEFAVALLLTVGRKTHKAYNRTRESNFSLAGLMGFDVNGKTIGVCGTGKIGRLFAKIMLAFGTTVLAYDVYRNPEAEAMGVEYVSKDDLFARSDIISLHCPLLPSTRHMIDAEAIRKMKTGVILINTSRGELMDMDALIKGLKGKKIGACAMDVVEGEAELFFDDHSGEILEDDRISMLMSFPNVLLTPHIAFCTDTAMLNIWGTTVSNMLEFKEAGPDATLTNEVIIQ